MGEDISRLKRLRVLTVAMVPAFDDDALIAVGGSCHALESLNLNGTSVQRATGLALLGAGLTDLALAHTLCVRLTREVLVTLHARRVVRCSSSVELHRVECVELESAFKSAQVAPIFYW